MDAIDRHRYRCREEHHHPSFSSTLLDVIYRSIDERDDENYRKSMRNRQSTDGCFQYDRKQNVLRSKNVSDVVVRRRSATGFECNSYMSSSIRSTGSRYSAGISSSEAETIYGFPVRPRPIRTNIHDDERNTRETNNRRMCDYQMHQSDDLQPSEGKFVKTKSRAMKICAGYLKKGKHPISPGGRLATFLISLFRTPNVKKSKVPSAYTGGHENVDAIVHAHRKPKSAPNASTCSSASSFSRSCLSKTPSSGKLATDVKRSVRFYPANVIVNEYSQPIGHKSLNGDGSNSSAVKFVRNSNNEEVKKPLTEKNRHRLKKYQRKFEYVFNSIKNNNVGGSNDDDEDEDEDEDEGGSYASSDLFELEHLCGMGMDGCMQELPLYETTSVDANRPIANGTPLI